jgi:predicted GNAT family acetyltransferase
MEPTVRNDPEAHRYEIREGGQLLGIVAYQHRGSTLVMTHTEVDQDSGRSGVGSALVRGALDDVRSQGIKVVPLCPFVRGWIDRHPDYADLVAADDDA